MAPSPRRLDVNRGPRGLGRRKVAHDVIPWTDGYVTVGVTPLVQVSGKLAVVLLDGGSCGDMQTQGSD